MGTVNILIAVGLDTERRKRLIFRTCLRIKLSTLDGFFCYLTYNNRLAVDEDCSDDKTTLETIK